MEKELISKLLDLEAFNQTFKLILLLIKYSTLYLLNDIFPALPFTSPYDRDCLP